MPWAEPTTKDYPAPTGVRNAAVERREEKKRGQGSYSYSSPSSTVECCGLVSGVAPGPLGWESRGQREVKVPRTMLAFSLSVAYQSWGFLDNLSGLLKGKFPCLL